ncbi:MAG: permease prefix domain 1-containing protein [Lachnospiraceae bacterium]|nr:permease prefix domain 1-containing protein [Lachnospiraceae bacterium]
MKEKIRQHFNLIFTDAPKTRKAIELKEEMMQSAMDKFDDMVADGYSAEDAYENVIHSIGDVTELFPTVEEKNLLVLSEKDRKKKALLTSIATGIYIFAAAVFFFFGADGNEAEWQFGFGLAILLCIVPTVMLVYAANMYPDYNRKEEPDMVELYKAAKYSSNKAHAVRKSINSIIWSVTLVLYFIISFVSYRWQVTWIIFLIAFCLQAIVKLVFELRADEMTFIDNVKK